MDPIALPEVTTESFSLISLFMQADLIVKAVMIILLVASVWSWAVAIDKWFSLMSANSKASRFENAFWSGQALDEMSDRSSRNSGDAMARVFAAGATEWRDARRGAGPTSSDASAIVDRARSQMSVSAIRESMQMEKGLSTLAIIASASPFIGLLGTVIGIMNAFRDIAAQGETNLTVVAPGIAEALFATAMGLAAAIPALVFYNKFSGDISRFAERLEMFAQEFAVRLDKRLRERQEI